jgi:hypothetical protein
MLSDERMRLTVLERGQLLRRLKEFYEAEHPQTKHGGVGRGRNRDAESAPLKFAKVTAEKLNKSERVVQEEVQVATRIPDKVQEKIKDLPVADNKSD